MEKIGLLININGKSKDLHYSPNSYDDNMFRYTEIRGNNWDLIEVFDYPNGFFEIYGFRNGSETIINSFDLLFNSFTYGDIIVINKDKNDNYIDICWRDFINIYYEVDNLSDYIIEDELSDIEEENEYDYDDSFIASEDEIEI